MVISLLQDEPKCLDAIKVSDSSHWHSQDIDGEYGSLLQAFRKEQGSNCCFIEKFFVRFSSEIGAVRGS